MNVLTDPLGGLTSLGFDAAFDAAGRWVAAGAVWLLDQVGHALSSTTSVPIGTAWFAAHQSVMIATAAAVVVPMLCVSAIQAVVRQSPATLIRSFLVQLPLAMLLTGVAVELVRIGLAVTDALSARVLDGSGTDTANVLAPVTSFLGQTSANLAVPTFVLFAAGLVVAVTAFGLWLELVIRAAAVSVAVLFLPLVLAALVWPAISHWARRLADTLAALILSKLVVAAVLSLAVAAMAGGLGGASGGGFAAVVTGVALLAVATLSPFTLLRLLPMMEAGAVAHVESARHRLVQAARQPARAANLALDLAGLARDARDDGVDAEDGAALSGRLASTAASPMAGWGGSGQQTGGVAAADEPDAGGDPLASWRGGKRAGAAGRDGVGGKDPATPRRDGIGEQRPEGSSVGWMRATPMDFDAIDRAVQAAGDGVPLNRLDEAERRMVAGLPYDDLVDPRLAAGAGDGTGGGPAGAAGGSGAGDGR